MFQRTSAQKILFIFAIILFFQSCKTDPAVTKDGTTADDSFTVVSRLVGEPDKLNPALTTQANARGVMNQIFSNLVHYDTKTLKAMPMLAKELPIIEEITEGEHKGKLLCKYEIHEEAIWDDGKPVTGHDVEFSIKAILNPKVGAAAYRAVAISFKDMMIDETNPKKFSLVSKNYFLTDIIFTDIPTFPAHIYDPKGIMKNFTIKQLSNSDGASKLAESDSRLQEFATEFSTEKFSREKGFVNGCGPYALEEWISGQRIVLKKKKNWWGDKLAVKYPLLTANPETIIYKPMSDVTTAVTELKAGSIDVMTQITADQYSALKESTDGQTNLNFHEPFQFVIFNVGMNSNRPKLSDKRVRRALAHLINMDEIINTTMYGYAEKVVGPIHPSRPYYHKGLALIEQDLDKARALLKEAGWEDTNGNGIVDKMIDGELTEMKLDYLSSKAGVTGQKIGTIFKANAKRVGVDIELVIKEGNLVVGMRSKRDFDLLTGGWAQDTSMDDPYQNWHTDSDTPSGGNRFGFGDEESDKIIEEIRTIIPEKRRNELYKRLQEIIYDEQPCIFLMVPLGRIAINKKFDFKPSVRKPWIFENEFKLNK
ncbi:MAG: ABC transporter substrate-binding protein [Saprospiraceae bacterium]